MKAAKGQARYNYRNANSRDIGSPEEGFPQGAFAIDNGDGAYSYDYKSSSYAVTGYTHDSDGAIAGTG